MIFARYISVAAVLRLVGLYVVLVLYGAAYEYYYAFQLTTLVHDQFTAFDISKLNDYRAICLLTPLAILPIGTRLRSPGQFIAGAAVVFLFIPIPIVFAAMVSEAEFWEVYWLLWLGILAACSLSSLAVRLRFIDVSERGFRHVMLILFAALVIGLTYALTTNKFEIASLAAAHEARESVTVSGVEGYVLGGYITSFGALLIAIAIMFRIGCYGVLSERTAVFMPAWIIYMWIAQRVFFRDSVTRFLVTAMAPFLLGVGLGVLLGLQDRTSGFYDAFTLANYRLYSIPAIGFVSSFVHYPYGAAPAAVLAEAYKLGNDNASFLQTDGLAAVGTIGLPFISLVYGLVLVGVNSCMRGLNLTMLAVVSAGAEVALIETGLGPGLLTNGVLLLSVVLLCAPRGASWNRRYLGHRPITAVLSDV